MLKIGLTGKIGSGKTTALKALGQKGAETFNSDQIIHEIYKNSRHIITKKIKKFFPEAEEKNEISPKKLGEIVFNDQNKLKKLEQLTHPFVIKKLKDKFKSKKSGIFVAEVPLLFEKNLEGLFDRVILVKSREDILIKRLKEKYGLDSREAKKRLFLFLTAGKKEKKSDFILANNSNLNELKKEVNLLWQKISKI